MPASSGRGSRERGVFLRLEPQQTVHRVSFTVLTRTAGVRTLTTSQRRTVAKLEKKKKKKKCQISVLRAFLGPSLTGSAKEDTHFRGLLAGRLQSHVSSLGVLGERLEAVQGNRVRALSSRAQGPVLPSGF